MESEAVHCGVYILANLPSDTATFKHPDGLLFVVHNNGKPPRGDLAKLVS